MRHFFGFVVGLLLAPALVAGSGLAAVRATQILRDGGSLLSAGGLVPFGVMAVLGLVAGVAAAAPRLSPMVAGVPGLALMVWTTLHLTNAAQARSLLTIGPLPEGPWTMGAAELLAAGVYALLGVLLFVPALVPSRWRGRRRRGAHAANEEDEYLDDLRED
ncbi:hypothetical protein [Allonocardiopsis opalescens]|uniref:Uncharacterized protein n=1 Tax=Allonocardiopsis opalescens TaxID=1144618 RepID=A0A2T0Q4H9_9ACTN|nr:hypothetical protein [Allonocardiopsis opalescens]PRX98702.1 hypothetical protein CLV72_104281 [Allonocardiopsis opalescens]